jgi:cAMP-dependent protein kinase regulator
MTKGAKIKVLKAVPLFARCTKEQLSQLAKVARLAEFPAGTVLIREGEPGRRFYALVGGTVEVRQNGRKLPTRGGEGFGEISLLLRRPTTATVTTTSATRALMITPDEFRSLLNDSPGFQRRILLAVTERLAPTTV